jgi:hypothetical protein
MELALFPFSALLLAGSFLLNWSKPPVFDEDEVDPDREHTRALLAKLLFITGLLILSMGIIATSLKR